MFPTVLTSLESLVGLRWHDGPDVRPTLLRVLTDLYIQKPRHSADEEQQYVALSLRLIDAVDGSVRTEVARRLAAYHGAPVAVLRRLAVDVDKATEQVLTPFPETSRPDDRREPTTVSCLDVPAPIDNFEAIACELNDIFFGANSAERRLIVINLDFSNAAPTQPMSAAYANDANRLLEAAALQGRLDEFIRELERVMKFSRELAERIVNDPSGEPLVVAAKALAMPIEILQRILLCVNPAIGHSVRRVFSLSALYRDMTLESALRLLTIWRAASPATRLDAKHRPVSWDDDARGPRDFIAASRRAARLRREAVKLRAGDVT